MKKALCLILSVIIALSTISVIAFADSVPEISIKTDKQTVRKSERVTVSVNVSKNSNICAATIEFNYDTDKFSIESATVNDNLGTGFVNDSAGNGKVRYVMADTTVITAGASLFTVELKVKKPNGKVSLDIQEVWVDSNGKAIDVTSQVKAKYSSLPETVLTCRHDIKEEIVSQATCTHDGSKIQKCTIKNCGWESEPIVIKATGHNLKTVTTQPTCDKDGKEYKECATCGFKTDETVIKAKGHSTKLVTVEPTCTKDGETYLQCEICGWKGESVVLKAGHKAGNWETVKEATETETGKQVKKCTVCGEVVDEKEIPAVTPERIKGDVNGDGKLTATDARMILRHVARIETLILSQMAYADVNGDYKITATDARRILRIVAGLEA